jgi:hypothetical protein
LVVRRNPSTLGDIVLGIRAAGEIVHRQAQPFREPLYRRIKANPARRLRIVTALSLEKPVGKSELEQHFLDPLVERVFGTTPTSTTSRTCAAPACRPTSRCASSS